MKAPPLPARPGRFYRVTYSNARPEEDPKLFQARDGMAFGELTAGLPAQGYSFGTTIHFYPDDERRLDEFPAFQCGDLLVLPTRPPLTDREAKIPPRRIIRDSKNELEKLLFKQIFRYLSYCTRKHVTLTEEAQRCLGVDPNEWGSLEFFENTGMTHPFGEAHIQKHSVTGRKPQKDQPPSTVGFLVQVASLSGVGGTRGLPCGLLAAFGMDGYSTLIWNRLLRVRFPELLTRPGFVMAQIIFKQPIPRRPLTPAFADNPDHIDVRLLTKLDG